MTREDDFALRSRAPIVDLDVTSRAVDTPTPPYGDDDGDHSAFTHRDDDEPPPYPVDTPTPPDHVGVHRAGYREDCPACIENDAAMAATPDPSIPERPEYQPAAATRLFANGGNLPSGSIPERPAEPLLSDVPPFATTDAGAFLMAWGQSDARPITDFGFDSIEDAVVQVEREARAGGRSELQTALYEAAMEAHVHGPDHRRTFRDCPYEPCRKRRALAQQSTPESRDG